MRRLSLMQHCNAVSIQREINALIMGYTVCECPCKCFTGQDAYFMIAGEYDFLKMYRNPVESFYQSSNCEEIESEMLMNAPRFAQLADYLLHQSGNNYQTYNELYVNKNDFPITTGTCMPFSKKLFVTVNGKILPCERISQQFSLGQVYEDRVELNEENVADKHNYYVSKNAKQCVNCALNRFCMQCVYQIDDICKDDLHCQTFSSKEEFERGNEDIFQFLEEHPHYYRRILEEVKIER